MTRLEEQINHLAEKHLQSTDGSPSELLRRLDQALGRKTERVQVLEDGMAGAAETLRRLANTGDPAERERLAGSLTETRGAA